MNFLEKRIKKFSVITKKFNHEKISSLVVANKINPAKFLKLQSATKKFVSKSKKYKFVNRTPNGKITPKIEVSREYLNVVTAYRDIILSLNFKKYIHKWVFPVVRYKDIKIDQKFNYRPNRSELPHSDIWAGWDSESLLVMIPLLGDTKNNRVIFYDLPKKIKKEWLTKKNYKEAQKNFANLCKPINHHYKKGYIYICDILAVHKTIKKNKCKPRASIDIPIVLKSNKKKNNYGINDCLNTKQILGLGKKFNITCPLKMGEIDGISGKQLPSSCKVIRS
jgi:hypothetical protein